MNPINTADFRRVLASPPRYCSRACATVAALFAALHAPASPAQVWVPLGPQGGRIATLLAEPISGGRVYAIGSRDMFRFDDAGSNWHHVGSGVTGNIERGILILDPDQPGSLYFSDDHSRLLRSDDYAKTWVATGYVGTSNPTYSIADLPSSSNSLLASMYPTTIAWSIDGGASFNALPATGISGSAPIRTLATNPADPMDMLGGVGFASLGPTSPALYRSRDGGGNWSCVDVGVAANEVRNNVYLEGGRILAKLDESTFLSLDDGDSWRRLPYRNVVALPGVAGGMISINQTECARTHDNFAATTSCGAGAAFELPALLAESNAQFRGCVDHCRCRVKTTTG